MCERGQVLQADGVRSLPRGWLVWLK